MGWFWDSKSKTDGDAYSKLDPTLREFLDKESPLKYEDTQSKPQQARPPPPRTTGADGVPNQYRVQLGLDTPGVSHDQQNAPPKENGPQVPRESLFPDGRYAHLWKGYRPQSEIEAASMSDQDKLSAVVDAYKSRKAAIGRAAVENCVMEQLAREECFRSGDITRLMTMCRTESRAFNRCYEMQSRFLKALGYLSHSRTEAEEERIQMHADKLYHEMLEREKAVEEAKKEGKEAPAFQPLIEHESTTKALGDDSAWSLARKKAEAEGKPTNLSAFPPEKQKEIKKRLEGKTQAQKEIELQLIAAESRAGYEYAQVVKETLAEEKQSRAERRERGRETIGDTLKRLSGWNS